jgi:hypothetical protein
LLTHDQHRLQQHFGYVDRKRIELGRASIGAASGDLLRSPPLSQRRRNFVEFRTGGGRPAPCGPRRQATKKPGLRKPGSIPTNPRVPWRADDGRRPLYRPDRPDEYLSHFSYSLANGYDVFLFLIFCNISNRLGNRGSHRVA